jgi:hypothetical protein
VEVIVQLSSAPRSYCTLEFCQAFSLQFKVWLRSKGKVPHHDTNWSLTLKYIKKALFARNCSFDLLLAFVFMSILFKGHCYLKMLKYARTDHPSESAFFTGPSAGRFRDASLYVVYVHVIIDFHS